MALQDIRGDVAPKLVETGYRAQYERDGKEPLAPLQPVDADIANLATILEEHALTGQGRRFAPVDPAIVER